MQERFERYVADIHPGIFQLRKEQRAASAVHLLFGLGVVTLSVRSEAWWFAAFGIFWAFVAFLGLIQRWSLTVSGDLVVFQNSLNSRLRDGMGVPRRQAVEVVVYPRRERRRRRVRVTWCVEIRGAQDVAFAGRSGRLKLRDETAAQALAQRLAHALDVPVRVSDIDESRSTLQPSDGFARAR